MGILVCMVLLLTVLPVIANGNSLTTKPIKEDNYIKPSQNIVTNPLGLITINIIAKVTAVADPDNLLKGEIKVNDTITGKYVYDSGIPDSNPNPATGHYVFISSSCGFDVKAGSLVFKTNPSDVEFSITISDNSIGTLDEYSVLSLNNLQLSNGMLVTIIQWDLVDFNGTAIDSDVLPTNAPDLADWKSQNTFLLIGKDPSDPTKIYQITAQVTKATKSKAVNVHETGSEYRTLLIKMFYQLNIPFIQFWIKLIERLSHTYPMLKNLLKY